MISMAVPLLLLVCLFSVKFIYGEDKNGDFFYPTGKEFSLDRALRIICKEKFTKTRVELLRDQKTSNWSSVNINFGKYKNQIISDFNNCIVDEKFNRYILLNFDIFVFFYPMYLSTPGKGFKAKILYKDYMKKISCHAEF